MLPSQAEVPELLPAEGSVLWQRASDARVLAAAGYALILQVSHPTVGAGVLEHSNFAADPWGRLLRTLDYVYCTVYGGPQLAADTGRRVREMHKQIKGSHPDGSPYHALEPEAYAWVHATLAEAIVAGNSLFGRPLRVDQVERVYADWRRLGRIVGVRERDLPPDWPAFRVYFDRMVQERLEDTQSVRDVLAALARPTRPPLPALPNFAWSLARLPAAHALELATVGMLPATLRERCGLSWGPRQERELRAVGRVSRALTPLAPSSLLTMGPGYLRWRRGRGGDSATVAVGGAALA